jgi:hypothetical protein
MTLGSESWEGVVVWLGGLGGNWSCFSSCLKKHGSHNPEYIGLYWVVLPPGNHQPTGFCERSHLRRRYRSAARLCRYQVDFFGNQACPCSCTFHSSWSLKPERFHSHHDSLLVEGTAKSDLGLMFFVGAKKTSFCSKTCSSIVWLGNSIRGSNPRYWLPIPPLSSQHWRSWRRSAWPPDERVARVSIVGPWLQYGCKSNGNMMGISPEYDGI